MIDYYGQLREPAFNSNFPHPSGATQAGQFDPLLSLVLLAPKVANVLDSHKGTYPGTSYEKGGSDAVRAYAGLFHETIHWWQHIGSTTGLLTGLTTAAQAALCVSYMCELGTKAPKPLLGALQSGRLRPPDENDPLWVTALRYREADLGNAFIVGPVQAFSRVVNDSFLYESIGHSIAMHHLGVLWYIGKIVDPEGSGFTSPEEWMDLYHKSVRDKRTCFGIDEVAKIVIGARDVFEGQARLCELQFHQRSIEPRTLAEFRQQKYLEGAYSTCFDYYLNATETSLPEYADSPEVNLFLLLCDFAINPSAGYPHAIPDSLDLLRDNHPGLRFTKLCKLAHERKQELLSHVRRLSVDGYERAAAVLSEASNWAAPHEVANDILEAHMRTSNGEALLDARAQGDFGLLDVPAKFILSEHVEFAEFKARCPHFCCWPGQFLTSDLPGDSPEIGAIRQLMEMASPPFLATSVTTGVDTVQIYGLSSERRNSLADRYFQNQATVDLFRQWMAGSNGLVGNPFLFNFSWKPQMSDHERANLKSSFCATFGVDIDAITILD